MKKNVLVMVLISVIIVIVFLGIYLMINKNNMIGNISNISKEEIVNKEEQTKQIIKQELDAKKIEEEQKRSLQGGTEFCKYGDYVVYINNYNNYIYTYNLKEKTGKKLCTLENGINKIYFDGEYIYCMPYYYRGKGIYKIDLQGNINKIYEGASLQLYIQNDKIYFVKQIGFDDMNQNPQGNICVMNKDGSDVKEITQNVKGNFFIQDDYIYYTEQSRKLCKVLKDGTNKTDLAEGRKFINAISDKYLIYLEFGNQEEKGIINLETNETQIVGKYGPVKKYLGDTYLYIRKNVNENQLQDDYTLYKMDENTATAKELNTLTGFSDNLNYIYKDNAYFSNQQEGTYLMNIKTKEKKTEDKLKKYNKYIGGYAYNTGNPSDENIHLSYINLDTLEEVIIKEN